METQNKPSPLLQLIQLKRKCEETGSSEYEDKINRMINVDDEKASKIFWAQRNANAARQAAFKEKMKSNGKRQVVLWLDVEQEKAVKDFLANTLGLAPEARS